MGKTYPQECPIGATMNVIGDRWTVMILRDLARFGPRRFQDFIDAFPSLPPNTLSSRLKALENEGIVERYLYEERPPRAEYQLTKKGNALKPLMKALRDWGTKYG